MPTLDEAAEYLKWRPQFAEILDPDYYPLEWLDRRFLDGSAIIRFCSEAACLLEIRTYPSGRKEVHALLCVGELSAILSELVPAMEALGGSTGAISAVIESRAGWHRTLKDSGYSLYQTTIRKPL